MFALEAANMKVSLGFLFLLPAIFALLIGWALDHQAQQNKINELKVRLFNVQTRAFTAENKLEAIGAKADPPHEEIAWEPGGSLGIRVKPKKVKSRD